MDPVVLGSKNFILLADLVDIGSCFLATVHDWTKYSRVCYGGTGRGMGTHVREHKVGLKNQRLLRVCGRRRCRSSPQLFGRGQHPELDEESAKDD